MSEKHYWYHISTTLRKKELRLQPRRNGFNRADNEPDIPRVCVAPTLEQCLVAVPYNGYEVFTVYRTKHKVVARPSFRIFDSSITKEHWITKQISWVRIGYVDLVLLQEILSKNNVDVPYNSADCVEAARQCLRKWKKIKPSDYISKRRINYYD